MNTMLRNTTAQNQTALAPSNLTTTGRPAASGGLHKGIWVGGGIMALTIVALATALVVKGNSSSQAVAPLAATATTPAPEGATAAATPTTVAQAQTPAQVTQAPVTTPAPAPTHTHHSPTHSMANTPTSTTGGGNTTVADAGTGAGATTSPAPAPAVAAPPPVCSTCGTVESFDTVKVQGQNNGIGAVGGGAVGAVLGSQIAGRNNHTLGGVIGAIGGGLLGNEIEKSQRTSTAYDVHIRMEDGSLRTVRESAAPVVGQKVTVNGNSVQPRSGSGSQSYNGGGNQPTNGSSFSQSGN